MAKFGPGNNANPSGRPKVVQEFKARCQKAVTETVLEKWIAEVESGGENWVKCSELLANYGMGKPAQAVELGGKVEHERVELDPDKRLAVIDALRASGTDETTH